MSSLYLVRRLIPAVLFAAATALVGPGLAHAEARSVVGCWKVEISLPFPMGSKKLTACFENGDKGLSGKVQKDGKGPWKAMTSAAQTGDDVEFVVEGEKGQMTFNGGFKSDKAFKGKVKTPKGSFSFKAQRKKG